MVRKDPGSIAKAACRIAPASCSGCRSGSASLFAMRLFFLLAGAMLPDSLERKGLWRFLRDRWMRLGWPLLVFVLLVVPLVNYAVVRATGAGQTLWQAWLSQAEDLDAGPLWFVRVLLLFSTIAAPILARRPEPVPRSVHPGLLAGTAVAVASSCSGSGCRWTVTRWERLMCGSGAVPGSVWPGRCGGQARLVHAGSGMGGMGRCDRGLGRDAGADRTGGDDRDRRSV